MLLIAPVAQPEEGLVPGETGMRANDSDCFVPKLHVLNAEEYFKSKSNFKTRLLGSTTTILFLTGLTIWVQDQELGTQENTDLCNKSGAFPWVENILWGFK